MSVVISDKRMDLIRLQEEDPTLQRVKELKGTETKKGYVTLY